MSGYEALRNAAGWLDLSRRGKIRVTGEDRARLLHAMSTNHVQGLEPGQGLYAFFLNDKGRILADAYIYNLGDSLFLDTEPETKDKLLEHLDRYIIADDATLEDETSALTAIELAGPASLDVAARLDLPISAQKYGVESWQLGFTARVSATGAEAVRIFLPAIEKEAFVEEVSVAGVVAATPEEARIVRIERGVGRYGEEISERYLVQETQMSEAVHSNKGCYLGQEIVERVRSRGQVHRLLTPVRMISSQPPAAGTKLSAEGADVAEISSAVYSPALGEVVGLAYVRAEAVRTRPRMIVAGTDPPVEAFIR